jgi:hypothetical protein
MYSPGLIRKERQLRTQPYLAGFILPESSVLTAEYQALGVGQRNCDLSGRHRQPQFNLEAESHRCAAGINRASIGRKFAFNGPWTEKGGRSNIATDNRPLALVGSAFTERGRDCVCFRAERAEKSIALARER